MPRTRYCSVYRCPNDSKTMPHLTYFGIPKNKESRTKWLAAIGREEWLIRKSSAFVCSTHFSKEMLANRRLKKFAIPSVNIPENRIERTLSWIRSLPFESLPDDPSASEECSKQIPEEKEPEKEQSKSLEQPSIQSNGNSPGTQSVLLYLEWPTVVGGTPAVPTDENDMLYNYEQLKRDNIKNLLNLAQKPSSDEPAEFFILLNSAPELNLQCVPTDDVSI